MSRHHPSLSVAAVVLSFVLLLSFQANPARGQEAPDALQGTDAIDAALSTAFSYQGATNICVKRHSPPSQPGS